MTDHQTSVSGIEINHRHCREKIGGVLNKNADWRKLMDVSIGNLVLVKLDFSSHPYVIPWYFVSYWAMFAKDMSPEIKHATNKI